jgi:hypothetical protein
LDGRRQCSRLWCRCAAQRTRRGRSAPNGPHLAISAGSRCPAERCCSSSPTTMAMMATKSR